MKASDAAPGRPPRLDPMAVTTFPSSARNAAEIIDFFGKIKFSRTGSNANKTDSTAINNGKRRAGRRNELLPSRLPASAVYTFLRHNIDVFPAQAALLRLGNLCAIAHAAIVFHDDTSTPNRTMNVLVDRAGRAVAPKCKLINAFFLSRPTTARVQYFSDSFEYNTVTRRKRNQFDCPEYSVGLASAVENDIRTALDARALAVVVGTLLFVKDTGCDFATVKTVITL